MIPTLDDPDYTEPLSPTDSFKDVKEPLSPTDSFKEVKEPLSPASFKDAKEEGKNVPSWADAVIKRVVFSEAEVAARCRELAAELDRDYKDKNPLLLGMLNGVFVHSGTCDPGYGSVCNSCK